MNNIMLAHMGGELLVVAGVSYYFHRRTSSLQQEIDTLKAQNADLIKAMESMGQDMQKLYYMIKPSGPPNQGGQGQEPEQPGPGQSHKKPSRPPQKKRPTKKPSSTDGEETLDDEDLDEMLKEDYKELKTPVRLSEARPGPKSRLRQTPKVEECVDEECSLID